MRVNIVRSFFVLAAIGTLLSQIASYSNVAGNMSEPAAMILFGAGMIVASVALNAVDPATGGGP